MFALDTVDQVKELLAVSCPTNQDGEYVAEELVIDQTLDNLAKFSKRLQETWAWMQDKRPDRPPLIEVIEHPKWGKPMRMSG